MGRLDQNLNNSKKILDGSLLYFRVMGPGLIMS